MNDGKNGSANAGSPSGPAINPNDIGAHAGQPTTGQGTNVDYERAYKELETRLGHQGQELGEYRTFFQNISPLLEKLDKDPVLVQAILDGKIDKDLATAVSEGRVSIGDAQQVTKANEEVKKALGKEEYAAANPKDIEKMVEERLAAMRQEFEQNAEMKEFEERTQKFIESTSDFADFADEIDKWLDTHDVTDIEVAYWAVKGRMSEAAAKQKAEEEAGERAKEVAQNASGGGVTAQYTADGRSLADILISSNRNPNVF